MKRSPANLAGAATTGAAARRGRILICADARNVHTQRWVREMAARGFDCVVLTRREAVVPGASEVVTIAPGGGLAGWFTGLAQVRRHAKRLAPQWVHGHYVTGYGLWAAASGLAPEVPIVLTAWGSDLLVTPREAGWRGAAMSALVNWSLARAALVTADAQVLLDEARRRAGGDEARRRAGGDAARRRGAVPRFEEIVFGADTERFRPAGPASPVAGFEIASLRAWEPHYRIDTVLRAFATLRRERPQAGAVLHLMGGGSQEAALKALAAQLGLGESARFLGAVGDASMISMLQRSRVSVSVPESDATSVALLESMACGLPVVASDLPANRQWLDATSGLLVRAGDEHALAQALIRLHDDDALAKAQGKRNRELVVRLGSRRLQMDRMATLYESLRLHAPRPAARPAA
ncbi:MAG TPA: glycosyltransferase [Methylibium sp.]|uniref:glycosyltransferase n=1 Tax=Methylibium sp. TaxID=2067992 RepID=UPI002DBC96C6|nr:glycosyltransferase [Methylibium sp.]HEU4460741.1 glycosyltransferase [Methylibium sp.]